MRTFLKYGLKTAAWLGGITLVVAGVLRLFFLDLVVVGHNGMAPTLIAGEEVLMWRGTDAEMGDVVICNHDTAPGGMVMGRVVARGGMSLKDERGALWIAGTEPTRDWQGETDFYDVDTNATIHVRHGTEELGNTDHLFFEAERYNFRMRETEVPAGHVFLMGDFRSRPDHDSRTFGTVPASNCIGSLFMRWKPVDDRGANLDHGWLDIIP